MIAILLALLATVNAPYSPPSYSCNGVTSVFAVTFPYQDPSHVVATSTTLAGAVTTLTYLVDYNLNVVSTQTTATLTLTNPASKCPTGSTLKITRLVPLTQTKSFSAQLNFDPTLHEYVYDRQEMQIQQLNANVANTGLVGGILAETNGGTGTGSLACGAGQVTTTNGTNYSCVDSFKDPALSRVTRIVSARSTLTTLVQDVWGYTALNQVAGVASSVSATLPVGYAGSGTLPFDTYSCVSINCFAGAQETSYNQWLPEIQPKATFIWLLPDSTAANHRYYVGLASGNPGSLAVQITSLVVTVDYVAFAFDAAAGTNTWFVCSGNGAFATCVDTGVGVTGTAMMGTLDLAGATTLNWTLANASTSASGTKTTNLPRFNLGNNSAGLGIHAMGKSITSITTNFWFGRAVLQTN